MSFWGVTQTLPFDPKFFVLVPLKIYKLPPPLHSTLLVPSIIYLHSTNSHFSAVYRPIYYHIYLLVIINSGILLSVIDQLQFKVLFPDFVWRVCRKFSIFFFILYWFGGKMINSKKFWSRSSTCLFGQNCQLFDIKGTWPDNFGK